MSFIAERADDDQRSMLVIPKPTKPERPEALAKQELDQLRSELQQLLDMPGLTDTQ